MSCWAEETERGGERREAPPSARTHTRGGGSLKKRGSRPSNEIEGGISPLKMQGDQRISVGMMGRGKRRFFSLLPFFKKRRKGNTGSCRVGEGRIIGAFDDCTSVISTTATSAFPNLYYRLILATSTILRGVAEVLRGDIFYLSQVRTDT